MPGLLAYWHTLRHLRAVQFYGRIWFRLVRPRIDLHPAPSLRVLGDCDWKQPARRRASLVGPGRFCFLNETHDLADHGWDDAALEKLWRYNLHYFDDLNAHDSSVRLEWQRSVLLRWVRENPPAVGTGWEPYPVSLRIVNWIKWALDRNALPPECVQSLAVQVRWLSRRLEIHLLGNHLFANAKALVFAGLFFEGPSADAWLEKGFRILEREVLEQILSDGGHFERSTMYHALALEDMLDLCNVTAVFTGAVPARWQPAIAAWRERIGPMRDWLVAMCHPDGEISYFNDAAVGIAPAPVELEQYAKRLGFPDRSAAVQRIKCLAASGYIRIENDGAVAILDVAPVGPDYLPGHAHADTLSFELSLFGRRVFVNSGTSCYGESVERLLQRGTAAHTTLVLNERNSSEVWGSFRVARRARVLRREIWRENEVVYVQAGHDGYRHHSGRPIHWRRWGMGRGCLRIEDLVEGSGDCLVEIFFHLHPDMLPTQGEDGIVNIYDPKVNRMFRVCVEPLENILIENSMWYPEFGASVPSSRLVLRKRHPLPAKFMLRIEY